MRNFIDDFKDNIRRMNKGVVYFYLLILILVIFVVLRKIAWKPQVFLMIIGLYTGIVFHEVAHGFAAFKMGDPTAKIAGRLTLNPLKHIDIIGFLLPVFLILTGAPFVLGWAKPVPISYNMLRRKKWGLFFVSIAGVVVNFINVAIASTILRIFFREEVYNNFRIVFGNARLTSFDIKNILSVILLYIVTVNLVLGIFNLLPIPPLDGSKILESFGNEKVKNFIESMERFGMIIIMVLLWTGVLDIVLNPLLGNALELIINKYIMGL